MKLKLIKEHTEYCISDNYISACGRFKVEKKFGFGNTVWWLIIDNTCILPSSISNCDFLRDARENIQAIMDSELK